MYILFAHSGEMLTKQNKTEVEAARVAADAVCRAQQRAKRKAKKARADGPSGAGNMEGDDSDDEQDAATGHAAHVGST